MAEAEDVIADAARHATSYAARLWRRNRPPVPVVPGAALADVHDRMALLVEAALGAAVPIRAASVPHRTLLSRLFERGRRVRCEALPGTDGCAIFLPPRVDDTRQHSALDVYRTCGLDQGIRLARGSAAAYPWQDSLLVQDLFLIGEAAAAHCCLVEQFPGMSGGLAKLRAALLSARPDPARLDEPLRCVERLYQGLLATGRFAAGPHPSPEAALRWARAHAAELRGGPRYAGLVADLLLGEFLRPDAAPGPSAATAVAEGDAGPRRAATLRRRPRARAAGEDEDDDDTGAWMIQSSQPSEHAEDAMGLRRPLDQDPQADLEGTADSIADLEALRMVSTPGSSREALLSDSAPCAPPRRVDVPGASGASLSYPEWDYRRAAYCERAATVRLVGPADGAPRWVDEVLARCRPTLVRVRRRFEALRARRSVQHGQPEGDELDLDSFVSAHGDRHACSSPYEKLYLMQRPAGRDFALLLLIDASGSTDAWAGSGQRIIDIEKEALVIVSAALDALRARFAIHAFSGHGPSRVRVAEVKGFNERVDPRIARRIAGLEPEEYTRAGAAVRHATATLMREPAHRRLLLMLSDGKPNDCDHYEGLYGVEDTRQAVSEARLQGIAPFCVTVDRNASRYLPLIFGARGYTVVRERQNLTAALLDWLRSVAASLA